MREKQGPPLLWPRGGYQRFLAKFHKMMMQTNCRMPANLDLWIMTNQEDAKVYLEQQLRTSLLSTQKGYLQAMTDWTNHSEDEDYALMACNNLDSDTEFGLGYGDHRYDGILSYENEVLQSVFMNKESSEPVVNESNIECQPKVWSDAPIIEEYESDSEDEYVSTLKEQETPSFANQQKRMARKAELNNGWNNVQRVNKQNQFVPSVVLTRTGKIPVSTARASSTKNLLDYPHRALKNKGIVDSGCSRHMTGNKAYLAEFHALLWPCCFWRVVKNPVYHSKTKHIAIRHHFIRDAYEKKLIQVLKIHTDDNVADLLTKAFDVSRFQFLVVSMGSIMPYKCIRVSLRRVIDGTEALLLSTLFILWLDIVSTDSAKLVPLGKVCTAIETLKKNTAKALISLLTDDFTLSDTMAVLDSCPKHNMVAYLEKSEGNAEFHEIIDFLKRSSIHHALTVNLLAITIPLDHFPVNALTSKDEGAPSERPSEAQPTPSPVSTSEIPIEPQTDSSPAHTSEVPIEQQNDPSPRPLPSTIIPDSIPETSGGNLGVSLYVHRLDQAKEIQHLKAQIKKLKKQAKPVIKHHRAWMQSISLKQRLARKKSSKKQWVHKESVSKQGRKFAKGCGRTSREIVDEDKESDGKICLYYEDVLSTERRRCTEDPYDEEMARKIQEEWEGEEERNRLAEEKATNEALIRNFDDIKARIEADRLLAEKLQEQEREQFTIEERAKFLLETLLIKEITLLNKIRGIREQTT
ncbi:hypothetical protein Tco_0817988 [Tanacetum coccineum]